MPTDTIGLFSSDARELYKADVYRALALPMGYVLHFRYPSQYVQTDLLTSLNTLINQEGTIFYVSGNDTTLKREERKLKLFSIRQVIIKDFVIDQNIDTIHFYLELKDFVDATPHSGTAPALLPPNSFVSKISVESGPNKTWINRANAAKDDFRELPFFLVESVRQGNSRLAPVYSEADKSSSYHLSDESDYQLNITFYDPLPGKTGLSVENGSSDVTLSIPPGHRIGAQSDTQVFKLQTHSLPTQKLSTFSRLLGITYGPATSPSGSADYRVLLEWTVTKKWTRTWQFGLLSILAALGVALAKLATDDLGSFKLSIANVILAISSAICIGLAAAMLYVVFNKK